MELVRSYSVTHPAGTVRLPQADDWDQIVYASRGTVRLTTAASTWVLPSLRAAWVPAGVEHRCRVTGGTRMRTLYVHRRVALLQAETTVVDLTPFARELVTHLVSTSPWVSDDPLTSAHLDVLGSVLRAAAVVPLVLPWPPEGAAARAADLVESDPGSQQSVADLARAVGVSRRTLEHAFVGSVGMTVGRWRQQLRLVVGLERLAEGQPVGRVAADLGYSTQSAFGAMFKAHLGCSPGTYFKASRD